MPRSSTIPDDTIRALVAEGWTLGTIAGMVGQEYSTIQKQCRRLGLKPGKQKRRHFGDDDGTSQLRFESDEADRAMAAVSFEDDPRAARRVHGPLPARALTNSYAGCATLAYVEWF